MKPFEHISVRAVQQAVDLLRQHPEDARIFAGGMEMLTRMKHGQAAPSYLISLKQVPSLRLISHYLHSNLEIGAFATIQQMADHPVLSSRFTLLTEAAKSIGTPQMRQRATIGGNILQRPYCSYFHEGFPCRRRGAENCPAEAGDTRLLAVTGHGPCNAVHGSDLLTALSALDASVMMSGPDGDRSVKLSSFLVTPDEDPTREHRLGPTEVLTKIIIPDLVTGARSTFRKVTARNAGDHALVSAALILVPESERLQKVHLTLGGVAPVPWRAEAAELFLRHNSLSDETIRQAAQLAVAGFEPLPGNRYKVSMAQSLVEDSLRHLHTSSSPSDYYDYDEDDEYYSYE